MFSYFTYRRACHAKQKEREDTIHALPTVYHDPLTPTDTQILSKPASQIISSVQSGSLDPKAVLIAYAKKALQAHRELNCLTEIMISQAEDEWVKACKREGPLAGMPISLKDQFCVEGRDSCISYSAWVGKPATEHAPLVRLLLDAGAIPFVKTTVPTTLWTFEGASDVFGVTENPHKKGYSPGGSSSGEAALLAFGGSRIGVGSDGAGSVRTPSHYSGVYTIKASAYRFLNAGSSSNCAGQEGVLAVASPMARTLEDLETFWKAFMSMKPWEYDHYCLPIPWREVDLADRPGMRWGVMWTDGVVEPSPACKRALNTVVSTLKSHGHDVIAVDPPSPYEGLRIGAGLMADDCKIAVDKLLPWENNDPGMIKAMRMFSLPHWVRRVYAWYLRHVRGDDIYAGLVETWGTKSTPEYFALVAERDAYREKWMKWWDEQGIDFILTVPNSLPAVPHGGMKEGFTACGYTYLFNVLNYSAGVMPITKVDKDSDALPKAFKTKNAVERGQYKLYNAKSMHGLPVGVQVVGRRFEEEKVLEGMKLIEGLLRQDGNAYELLET